MARKLSSLESLRGVAALIVVVDHSINMFAPNIRWTNVDGLLGIIRKFVAWTPFNLVYSGIPAVWIFFLLSGFVLSLKALSNQDSLEPLISGASKRYFRLMIPILGAAIVFCGMSFVGCQIGGSRLCSFPTQRVLFEAIYTAPFTHQKVINTPLWTISWEIRGSFIIFAVLAALVMIKNTYCRIIILALALYYTYGTNYYLFIIGLIVCYLHISGIIDAVVNKKSKLKSLVLLSVFAVSLFLMSYPFPRENVELSELHRLLPSFGAWYANASQYTKLGAILFFVAFMLSPLAKRTVDNSFTRFLGYISFSIYILHYPLFFVIKNGLNIGSLSLTYFIPFLIAITFFLFGVSWMFAKYVDAFSITFSNRIGRAISSVFYYRKSSNRVAAQSL